MEFARKYLFVVIAVVLSRGFTYSQSKPSPTPAQNPVQQSRGQREVPFSLADYGVGFQPDARLIVVMAALDAAGFDPTPAGREPSVFRARVRRDQAALDPDLRERLRGFYERNKLPAPATTADQAARYISLAYVLGPPPALDAPERSEDLPAAAPRGPAVAALLYGCYSQSG